WWGGEIEFFTTPPPHYLTTRLGAAIQQRRQFADAADDATAAAGLSQRPALVESIVEGAGVLGGVAGEFAAQGFLGLLPGDLAALPVGVGNEPDALARQAVFRQQPHETPRLPEAPHGD